MLFSGAGPEILRGTLGGSVFLAPSAYTLSVEIVRALTSGHGSPTPLLHRTAPLPRRQANHSEEGGHNSLRRDAKRAAATESGAAHKRDLSTRPAQPVRSWPSSAHQSGGPECMGHAKKRWFWNGETGEVKSFV